MLDSVSAGWMLSFGWNLYTQRYPFYGFIMQNMKPNTYRGYKLLLFFQMEHFIKISAIRHADRKIHSRWKVSKTIKKFARSPSFLFIVQSTPTDKNANNSLGWRALYHYHLIQIETIWQFFIEILLAFLQKKNWT